MSINPMSRTGASLRDHAADLTAAFNYIRQLCEEKYFGTVVLSIQAGILTTVRRDECLKPETIHTNLMASSRGVSNGARNSE